MVGEIEKDGGVLVIRRIHVTYHLRGAASDQREAVERCLDFHADRCPVARSIKGSIQVTTELEYVD